MMLAFTTTSSPPHRSRSVRAQANMLESLEGRWDRERGRVNTYSQSRALPTDTPWKPMPLHSQVVSSRTASESPDDDTADLSSDAGSDPAAAQMSLHEALRTRRTINAFAADLPADWESALDRAVESATFAPNHKRTEPWRFHLLGPEAIERVCQLNAGLVAASKGEAAGAKKLERWLAMPGWLVVTCVGLGDGASMESPMGVGREDYAACCCAVQNLCLALHADGVGTKWTSGAVNFDPRFRACAGVPDDQYVVGTIWFGEATGTPPQAPQKRLSLQEVMTRQA